MNDKIDVHQRAKRYALARNKLESDESLHPHNRELICRFLDDCALGKTIRNRSRKKIGVGRLSKYITDLPQVARWLNKLLDEVRMKDMEAFIQKLEGDVYCRRDKKPFTPATKLDFKKAVRKFYKWLWGKNQEYPELVTWFDTYDQVLEIPALRQDEVLFLVECAPRIRDKALIMTLFDGGPRIEELLNVRLKDVSQTPQATRVRIRHSKTKPRTISLPLAHRWITVWLQHHPTPGDQEAALFPVNYPPVRQLLSRLGYAILKKRVTAHVLRHSSATYYAPRLNWAQLCYRYGWSLASKMPQRYIDREGLPEQDTLHIIKQQETNDAQAQITALWEELARLKADHAYVQERENRINQPPSPFSRDLRMD